MRRKILSFTLCLLLVFLALPLASLGANPIDPQRESSLTLQYRREETFYGGLTVKTYRVAEIFADGTYELTGDFAEYPVNIYGITSKTEWDSAVSALAGYAEADKLTPTAEGITDSEGKIVFDGLQTGMYLTLGLRHETPAEITVFEAFLTSVPTPMEDAEHLYDVTVFPKSTSFVPTPEEGEFKVVKVWKDEGYESRRPVTLTVDILKDGVLQSTQTLSAENNWSYRWTAPLDGSRWTAVERNVPDGYRVAVELQDRAILLSNTYDEKLGGPKPPHTGDTPVAWPYLLACGGAGCIVLILAVLRKRRGE